MATSDIVQRTKGILYGAGLGESPVIVLANADAAEAQSQGVIWTFALASGEAAKVEAGDVLAVMEAADASSAFVSHVVSVNATTDVVTVYNGWGGAPSFGDTDLDSAVLEIVPSGGATEHYLYQMIETVIDTFLYPDVYEYTAYTVTPDLSDYQVELNAAVMEIVFALQSDSNGYFEIPFNLRRDVSTTVSSTGVLGELYAPLATSVYITAKTKFTESSTFTESMTQLIATGAAALAAGANVNSETLDTSSDEAIRETRPEDRLWRDFVTLRQSYSEELSRDEPYFETVR